MVYIPSEFFQIDLQEKVRDDTGYDANVRAKTKPRFVLEYLENLDEAPTPSSFENQLLLENGHCVLAALARSVTHC